MDQIFEKDDDRIQNRTDSNFRSKVIQPIWFFDRIISTLYLLKKIQLEFSYFKEINNLRKPIKTLKFLYLLLG